MSTQTHSTKETATGERSSTTAIPAVYLQYAGDEIVWPADRTSAGFLNTPEVRARNAEAARANDARRRSRSGYGYAKEVGR